MINLNSVRSGLKLLNFFVAMAEPNEFPSGVDGSDTLQRLDAAARCSICYSFYDAPLTLRGCGHSCKQLKEPPPISQFLISFINYHHDHVI